MKIQGVYSYNMTAEGLSNSEVFDVPEVNSLEELFEEDNVPILAEKLGMEGDAESLNASLNQANKHKGIVAVGSLEDEDGKWIVFEVVGKK